MNKDIRLVKSSLMLHALQGHTHLLLLPDEALQRSNALSTALSTSLTTVPTVVPFPALWHN